MLQELKLDKSVSIENDVQNALDRANNILNELGKDGYFKIKIENKEYVIIRYNSNKETKYVLGFASDISQCLWYLNVVSRVMLYDN